MEIKFVTQPTHHHIICKFIQKQSLNKQI